MTRKFIRTDSFRHLRTGKNRKKLQVWRRAKGIDNKIRIKRRGHPKFPTVGHKNSRQDRGKINGKIPVTVYNMKDLAKAGKDSVLIIGRIGARKRIEIIKKAAEMKMPIANMGREKK